MSIGHISGIKIKEIQKIMVFRKEFYEPGGWEFESLRVFHPSMTYGYPENVVVQWNRIHVFYPQELQKCEISQHIK